MFRPRSLSTRSIKDFWLSLSTSASTGPTHIASTTETQISRLESFIVFPPRTGRSHDEYSSPCYSRRYLCVPRPRGRGSLLGKTGHQYPHGNGDPPTLGRDSINPRRSSQSTPAGLHHHA